MRLGLRTNIPIVRQGLEDFKAEVPKVGRLRLYKLSGRILSRMKIVPSELPHQKYARTGKYVASWKLESIKDGYILSNSVTDKKGRPYGFRVAGDAYGQNQAKIHQGRWSHFRDTTDEEVRNEPPEAAAALRLVARRTLPNQDTLSN